MSIKSLSLCPEYKTLTELISRPVETSNILSSQHHIDCTDYWDGREKYKLSMVFASRLRKVSSM